MTMDSTRIVRQLMAVQNEFLETPALRLTLREAQRRFGLDRITCDAVLGTLVNSGVLARTDDGRYVRFFPRLRRAA